MIIRKGIAVPVFVLLLLFSSLFVSIVAISNMPNQIMGGRDIYVLTSSVDRNPLRSNLDIGIAYGIENLSYVEAVSPEIFVFTTVMDHAITVRGVIFSKLLSLENGHIVKGNITGEPYDALVGINVQKSLGIKIGKKLTLYGAFISSMAIVNVTGVYQGSDVLNDEILVTLSTARKLAGIGNNEVSIIRVKTHDQEKIEKIMDPQYPKFRVFISSPHESYSLQRFNVTLMVENMGTKPGNCSVEMRWNGRSYIYNLTNVESNRNLSVMLKSPGAPGNYTLCASVKNDIFYYASTTNIEVRKRPIFINGDTTLYINKNATYFVTGPLGENVENVTLIIVGPEYRKEIISNSPIRVSLPRGGNYTLTFSAVGYKKKSMEIRVYKRYPFWAVGSVRPFYKGSIILPSDGSIYVNTSGKIFYSIDNRTFMESKGIIKASPILAGYHDLCIKVYGKDYVAEGGYPLYVVAHDEPRIEPVTENGGTVPYGGYLTFQFVAQAPVVNATVYINREKMDFPIYQNFEKNMVLYNYTLSIPVNCIGVINLTARVYFSDALGNVVEGKYHYNIFYQYDIIPPEIKYGPLRIWGGNSTYIDAEDNVGVAKISVEIFGRYFNGTGDRVNIETMFLENGVPVFVKEGEYKGRVTAWDVNGNVNTSYFTLIINNSHERIPPYIIGPSYANVSIEGVTYRAYDNVAVRFIKCYENGSLIKVSYNGTLTINPEDLGNGLHHLTISSKDVNENLRLIPVVLWKNYTDNMLPTCHLLTKILPAGKDVILMAEDNVGIKRFVAYFSYLHRYFNASLNVLKIPTMWMSHNVPVYLEPGKYKLRISVEDIFGNENHTELYFEINNTGEDVPPIVLGNSTGNVSTEPIIFRAYDNVGVKTMFVEFNSNRVFQVNSSILKLNLSVLKYLPVGYDKVRIYAEDVNGNLGYLDCVLHMPDIVPPEIRYGPLRIWGGNSTYIDAEDNVGVAKISVEIFGRYFNGTGDRVNIETMFLENGVPVFVKEGEYKGRVTAWDVNGNVNTSYFTLIINNSHERIPPYIYGPQYVVMDYSSTVVFRAYDNSQVKRIWVMEDNETIFQGINMLTIHGGNLDNGVHRMSVVAQDIHGNMARLNVTLVVNNTVYPHLIVNITSSVLTPKDVPIVYITMQNENRDGYAYLNILLDEKLYMSKKVLLNASQVRGLNITLPKLSVGEHTIHVNGHVIYLEVKPTMNRYLPMDLILKYAKNLKISESQDVVYRGFQISQGNMIITFSSLIFITIVLVFLGIYYSTHKGMKISTLAILRAIGASNRKIFSLLMEDMLKYLIPAVIGGILGGYFLILGLNTLSVFRAFGHTLIIQVSLSTMLFITLLGIAFIVLAFYLAYLRISRRRVVHLMGAEENRKVVTLEEVLK